MLQSIHVSIILREHEIHVSEMVSKCLRKLYYYRLWSNNNLFCALYLFHKCMQKIMEQDMITSHLSSKRRKTIHQHILSTPLPQHYVYSFNTVLLDLFIHLNFPCCLLCTNYWVIYHGHLNLYMLSCNCFVYWFVNNSVVSNLSLYILLISSLF